MKLNEDLYILSLATMDPKELAYEEMDLKLRFNMHTNLLEVEMAALMAQRIRALNKFRQMENLLDD